MKEKPVWERSGEERREGVRALFDEIAPSYDQANGLMSLGRHHAWRTRAVRGMQLQAGQAVLDLCCGTGDFHIPIRAAIGESGRLVGLDASPEMLDLSRKKGTGADELILGDATELPFEAESFDGVTIGWGLRNVPSLEKTLAESARVLRRGGHLAIVEMSHPGSEFMVRANGAAMKVMTGVVGRIVGSPSEYRYLAETSSVWLRPEALAERMAEAGFACVRWERKMFGAVAIHWGVRA